MLVFEDLIAKMKIHFPRWMDIRRKIKSSNGGNYLSSIAEEITEIQTAIDDYKKDFFIDKYLGKEDEVLTYLFKVQIGNVDIHQLEIIEPKYSLTTSEKEFYENDNIAYYQDGSIYVKEDIPSIQYSIDGFKSTSSLEKIHVWNIFDEFAIFIGLRRYQWESNKELLNRILAFSHNRPNSTEIGLKNAILNNLINIAPDITADDINIERPTPENLNLYYDRFETILDHLANVNRDVYRTKRWDLDTWNFAIKSVDYIPHAWDVVLNYYTNGIGFDDDLKVEIVDAEMKTDATIYFYKKTLEYINSYIKNNNIKETIKLNLVKHSDSLKPVNVKYRITGTEIKEIKPDEMFIESYDYKVGNITQYVNDLFDPEVNEHNNVEIIDSSILNHEMNYKIRFRSKKELQEMSIDSLKLYNTETKEYRNLIIEQPGFEKTIQDGVRCTLTRKYLSEKYHYTNLKNAHKEIEGFVITDVEKPTQLKANIDACENETIFYKYYCEEIPVLFHNIERTNCYIENNSILSDTVDGEKFVSIKIKANSFSCKIHGAHKIMYSVNNGMVKTVERLVDDELYDFKLDNTEMPQDLDIKIYLYPKNNKQCAITNVMYSKYEFNITTEKGDLVDIMGEKRLPNVMDNNLLVNMKTYIGFSPVLEYIYIGTKVQNITYGDISFQPQENEKLIMSKTNCTAELEEYDSNGMLQHVDLDYLATNIVKGLSSDSYISINLKNFKSYRSITADRCIFESISYGSQVQHIIKIPSGVPLKTIEIVGEYEKLVFKETVGNVLTRKGYPSEYYSFNIAKTNDNILVKNNENNEITFIKLKRNDLISYTTAKVKVTMNDNDIQTVFIEDSINKISSITNDYEGSFDYISFYPMATKIYKAINEYNVISPVTNVAQIINTFDNNYTIYNESSLYYLIESLNEDFDVKFVGNKIYSIDSSSIVISKKDTTKLDFDYETVTVVYDSIIGNTIEIPDSFTVNKDKIETAKYIIYNNDLDIQYLNKHNDPLHKNDYIITENIVVNELMCNKLKYCNIEEIEEIYINNGQSKITLDSSTYSLFKTEGVINWLNIDTVNPNSKIFIKYSIKKPKYIRISIDELYEKVNYSANAYELLNKIDLFEVANNENFNLSMYEEYKDSDLISVKCSNIGFEAIVDGTTLMFVKNLKNNTIAVKSGYYYLDGDEYYLFADENKNNIENIDNLYFFNVTKENKKLYLNQTTTNLISNSALKANATGSVFSLDCQDKYLEGISKINAITTCENFNYWKSIGMDMAIVKGLNGSGIKFRSVGNVNGYSYLNISKHLKKDSKKYVISFYMKGIGEAYLGEERKIYSHTNEFNKQSIIEAKVKALKSAIEDDIYELEFTNDNKKNYYLIIKGNVIVDDIIVAEKEIYNLDFHTKNISFLNLDISENIYANYETRLYLDDTEGAIFEGTESKDDMIINSSYIDWGFTKIKELKTYDHFKKCILENIDIVKHNDECYIKTTSNSGKLTTNAIYIGNVNTIKNLLFKVNDVMFDNMKNFRIRLLTSSNAITGFKEVSMHLDNIGAIDGDKLSSYVKLIVEMPPNKVINNIELFSEYLSDANNNPPEIPVISGTYTSKVLDGQYNARFIIKNLGFELTKSDMNNISFLVRASKENANDTVWTDWKTLKFTKNEDKQYVLDSRIVFEGYRYFQFKTVLNGVNASVKIKYLDLEVI